MKTFTIPLQTSVEQYIKEKKNWPDEFCTYYAARFWNFYQSNGWKVSGKAAMKDWKAAFNSQWQTLKFKEDVDFYNKCMAKNPSTPQGTKEICYLNDRLLDYKNRWDTISQNELALLYDYLKERKMIKMSQEIINQVRQKFNGNVAAGKAYCVKIAFDQMISNNLRFKEDIILRLA